MDCNRNYNNFQHTSLLLLSFLEQKGCQNSELAALYEQLKLPTNHNYIESDEELQTDGHSPPVTNRDILYDLQNQVQPQLPGIFTIFFSDLN